jgi:hypothetical protein
MSEQSRKVHADRQCQRWRVRGRLSVRVTADRCRCHLAQGARFAISKMDSLPGWRPSCARELQKTSDVRTNVAARLRSSYRIPAVATGAHSGASIERRAACSTRIATKVRTRAVANWRWKPRTRRSSSAEEICSGENRCRSRAMTSAICLSSDRDGGELARRSGSVTAIGPIGGAMGISVTALA